MISHVATNNSLLLSYHSCHPLSLRKYDPSAHLDRSDSFFPDEYVTSICSRVAAVSRLPGAEERVLAGRSRGAKHIFQPMYRPKVLDLRYETTNTTICTTRRLKIHILVVYSYK
jgi:hypothetical protein